MFKFEVESVFCRVVVFSSGDIGYRWSRGLWFRLYSEDPWLEVGGARSGHLGVPRILAEGCWLVLCDNGRHKGSWVYIGRSGGVLEAWISV